MKLPENTRLSIKSIKVHYDESEASKGVRFNKTMLEIEYAYTSSTSRDTQALLGGVIKWPIEDSKELIEFNEREHKQNEEAWTKLFDLKILGEEIISRLLEDPNNKIEITSKVLKN